ncbi:hypothetical protein Tco_1356678 [Tanacetum coccineum]
MWSINIVDEYLDSLSTEDDNDTEKVADHMDDNSVGGLKDILNELKVNKKENGEISETSKDEVDKANTEDVIASHSLPSNATESNDLSLPHGFEHLRMVSLSTSRCSTSFMNKAGIKLSKLDRFLISKEVIEAIPDLHVTALDQLWSDHNPILLHHNKSDFGLVPLKLYHSWFLCEGFDAVISTEWTSLRHNNDDRKLFSYEKLKCLNTKIKQWHGHTKNSEQLHKHEVLSTLKTLEEKIEVSSASLEDRESRIKLL